MVTDMLVQEKTYLVYIIGYFIIAGLYLFVAIRLRKRFQNQIEVKSKTKFTDIIISLVLIYTCFIGIRGRINFHPLRMSEAYYCNDSFLNQLGINPAYNFIKSGLNSSKQGKALDFIATEDAIKYSYNKCIENNTDTTKNRVIFLDNEDNPLLRKIVAKNEVKKKNVVIVIIESMSANFLQSFGQEKVITPTLDSLFNNALAFKNCYASAPRTFAGIYGTLYSIPTIYTRNFMKSPILPHVKGLPGVLHDYGYKNMFFLAHEPSFDNINSFLLQNHFDEIHSMLNFPEEARANSWGVNDGFLYDYSLERIDNLVEETQGEQPFFASILTMTNHPPYVIPESFKPRDKDLEIQVVEYTDWCINDFLKKAKTKSWYDDTIFVFLGDHGKLVGEPKGEFYSSYNHIPLIFLNSGLPNEINSNMALQIDVMPTLLSMLNMSYSYDGLGVSLITQKRDMIFYCSNDLIAGRDSSMCSIFFPELNKTFYYHDKGGHDITSIELGSDNETDMKLKRLKDFSLNMLQMTDYMQRNVYVKPSVVTN